MDGDGGVHGHGRVGSGSGGVQNIQMSMSVTGTPTTVQLEDLDHYDFINAPQFVDFNDLGTNDDPNAELFFETHREEDDFMISIDNISPTVQLMAEQQQHQVQVHPEQQNMSKEELEAAAEANQRAEKLGMQDIQVTYYSSPDKRKTGSLNSTGSFYTPMSMGEMRYGVGTGTGTGIEGGDKENYAPETPLITHSSKSNHKGLKEESAVKSAKDPSKKLSYSAALGNDNENEKRDLQLQTDENQHNLNLNVNRNESGAGAQNNQNRTKAPLRDSLLSQLEKLQILSSDEEDAGVEAIEELQEQEEVKEYESPTKSINTDEGLVNTLLKTPGALPKTKIESRLNGKPLSALKAAAAISQPKRDFFEGLTICSPAPLPSVASSTTTTSDPSPISNAQMETETEVKSECDREEFFKQEFPVFQGLVMEGGCGDGEGENRKMSFLVDPSVGKEVVWAHPMPMDAHSPLEEESNANITVIENTEKVQGLENVLMDELLAFDGEECNGETDADDTLTSSFDAYQSGEIGVGEGDELQENVNLDIGAGTSGTAAAFYIEMPKTTVTSTANIRRASSLTDLTNAQRAMFPRGKPKGRNLLKGQKLTVPQSPDASKRVTKCRSAMRTGLSGIPLSDNNGSNVSMASVTKTGGAGAGAGGAVKKSYVSSAVPYKGAMALGAGGLGGGCGFNKGPLRANHYVSMAEAVTKFHKNTPDRFRSYPRGKIPQNIKRSNSCEIKLPCGSGSSARREPSPSPAVSPRRANMSQNQNHGKNSTFGFGGRSRVRTSSVGSASAPGSRPASAAASSSTLMKTQTIPHRTTIPQPFNFSSTRTRANTNEMVKKELEFKFKARPAPVTTGASGAFGAGAGVAARPQLRVTMPIAPHFASDDRIRERNKKAQLAMTQAATAASATQSPTRLNHGSGKSRIPTSNSSNQNQNQTLRAPTPDIPKTTSMKPFSFDQRDREMLKRKEEKIKQEIQEEQKIPEFHANPLPKFESIGRLPPKKPQPGTHVEPFKLKSDERGSQYQDALRKKVEEDERRLKDLARFQANEAVVLTQPAFEPEHPARPPLEALPLHLFTEKRAVERGQYDEYLRQKEQEEEEKKQQEELKAELEEREKEMERRRGLVHKAQPFKAPRPFQLKSSKKVLTIPQSPAFHPLPSQRRIEPKGEKENGNGPHTAL